jgi:DNA polymerase III subunit epsilon
MFVIVDVETTGGSPQNSKITELAMYKFDGTKIIEEFTTLLNPEMEIPEFIVRLTGITDQMVANAPKFFEVAKQILEFTNNCVFVAHNVSFDYGMFRSEFKRLGYDFRLPHLCTVRSSRNLLPGHASYSLGKITRDLGISIVGRHRAGGDALATCKLFEIIYKKDEQKLRSFIQDELNPKSLHPNLDLDTIEAIPNKTGVYLFHNEFNELIYVGKSIHIRTRIEQHLRNTKSVKGLNLIQDIASVKFELCGSELIALLRESELIKEKQPIYNRKLRKNHFPFGLFDELDSNGYIRLKVKSSAKETAYPIASFTSKKEGISYLLKIIEKYKLCQKLCNLYNSSGGCFQYSVKTCDGACMNKINPNEYNQRVNNFVTTITLDNKTFYIVDKGRNNSEKSLVLIENGTYRGHGFAPFHFHGKETRDWKKYIDEQKENKDIRTIINQFIRKGQIERIVEI